MHRPLSSCRLGRAPVPASGERLRLSGLAHSTKIRRVNIYLKIAAALASLFVLWLGAMYVVYLRDEAARCHTLTLPEWITAETFNSARECLVRSTAPKKTVVVNALGGGDGEAALAIGMLIHKHNWDVEVVDSCVSACAAFIFPAGNVKYLHRNAILVFHGGPSQRNLSELVGEVEKHAAANGAAMKTFGEVNKEGYITYNPGAAEANKEVREFLSIRSDIDLRELVEALIRLSNHFYAELGVNPLLPDYGQIGAYEPTYQAYEHIGFMYRLNSLQRLGVDNIELADGEWSPESHPMYQHVYEVTYP